MTSCVKIKEVDCTSAPQSLMYVTWGILLKIDLAGLGQPKIMHFNDKLPGDDSAVGQGPPFEDHVPEALALLR